MKLYIESAQRVSGTAEDFVYQIPTSIDLPASLAYVECVLLPNTIYTIKDGMNDRLYLREGLVSQSGGSPSFSYVRLVVTAGQYNGVTLALMLQTNVNLNTTLGVSTYTVTFDLDNAKLRIATTAPFTSNFTFYGETSLPDSWNAVAPSSYVISEGAPTRSANKVCGFVSQAFVSSSAFIPAVASDVIDIQRHHVTYIHSDLGIPGVCYGPRGETDIIRRVIIEVPQNALAIDRHSTAHDYVEVAPQPLKSIKFALRGSDGNVVDLHGHEWSFSLIFHKKI